MSSEVLSIETIKAGIAQAEQSINVLSHLRKYPYPEKRFSFKIKKNKTEPLIGKDDTHIFTSDNFSCITGQAKSKKTFLISAMVGAILSDSEYMGFDCLKEGATVLYFDTEQSYDQLEKVARRIHKISGFSTEEDNERFIVYHLQAETKKDRKAIVQKVIDEVKPDLCIIDGIADLMSDVNSPIESGEIAEMLQILSAKYHCHILTVLHTNPGGDKARGHIGSEITRKAETVINLTRDGENTRVTPMFCRHREFQEFYFTINAHGLPELTDYVPETPLPNKNEELFRELMPLQGTITYTEIVNKIMDKCDIKDRQAKKKISQAIESNIITKNEVGQYYLNLKDSRNEENLPF